MTKKTTSKKESVLVLRTCSADMRSRGGFVWPKKGVVKCADWNPVPVCGQGLHGLLWGEGDGSLLDWSESSKWLVVEVDKDSIVDLGGKVKFPLGRVVYCGSRDAAIARIVEKNQKAACVGLSITAGYNGQATAGYYGQATAGYNGQATAGDYGQATAGNYGQATAGDNGQATAGNYGQATAGYNGQATAGDNGIIMISWFDREKNRYRISVGYPGEGGIESGKTYRLDYDHKFVEVSK